MADILTCPAAWSEPWPEPCFKWPATTRPDRNQVAFANRSHNLKARAKAAVAWPEFLWMRADSDQPIQALRDARAGETVRVLRLEGQEALCSRLREMGFCEQAEVRILNNSSTVVCSVCGSRVGLSRQLAGSILVSAAAVA